MLLVSAGVSGVPYCTFEAHQVVFMARSGALVVTGWLSASQQSRPSFSWLHCYLFALTSVRHLVPTRARRGRYRLSSTVAMLLLLHTSAQTSSTAYQRVAKSHPPWPAFSANRKEVQAALGKRHVQSNHHSRIVMTCGDPTQENGWRTIQPSQYCAKRHQRIVWPQIFRCKIKIVPLRSSFLFASHSYGTTLIFS